MQISSKQKKKIVSKFHFDWAYVFANTSETLTRERIQTDNY